MRKYIHVEKPHYPEKYRKLEEAYLKTTFEGNLLYGTRPFEANGYKPYKAIVAHNYIEVAKGNGIWNIPYEVFTELYPEELENPNRNKRAVDYHKNKHKSVE